MHTVCELDTFISDAADAGMSAEEVRSLIDYLAEHPEAGEVMRGTGGCRKVRWAGKGKGKSGGYRTITFFSGDCLPVFLLTVFRKASASI